MLRFPNKFLFAEQSARLQPTRCVKDVVRTARHGHRNAVGAVVPRLGVVEFCRGDPAIAARAEWLSYNSAK